VWGDDTQTREATYPMAQSRRRLHLAYWYAEHLQSLQQPRSQPRSSDGSSSSSRWRQESCRYYYGRVRTHKRKMIITQCGTDPSSQPAPTVTYRVLPPVCCACIMVCATYSHWQWYPEWRATSKRRGRGERRGRGGEKRQKKRPTATTRGAVYISVQLYQPIKHKSSTTAVHTTLYSLIPR